MEYKVSEKDLIGDIKDFPIEIVQKMVDCQVKQGNYPDVIAFQNINETNLEHRGFAWSKTEEGLGFWDAVICEKNFNLFFQIYPKSNQVTIQKDMETNKLILNGITLPTDTEVKVSVEDGATIITFSKQESESKEQKFNDGDILFIEDNYCKTLSIYKSQDGDIILIRGFWDLDANEVNDTVGENDFFIKKNIEVIRYATEEEIVKFNKEFAEQKHLKWNAKEFKFEEFRWRAEKGSKFWFITSNGEVDYAIDNYTPIGYMFFNSRNYFQTEELAKKALPLWKEFFKNLSL